MGDRDRKVLRILGSSEGSKSDENIHQLPIKNEYQFYGDLYAVMLNKNVIQDLDLENFENIYNALYCESDDSENSDIEEEEEDDEEVYGDIDEQDINEEEDDEENMNIDNYGDEGEENFSDDESVVDIEEKKKTKKKKR